MREFDVIVVGGGPAGLMAARKAAERGAKTILLEREYALGTKACGEAISISTIKDAGVKPKSKFLRNRVDVFRVHAPDEEKYIDIHTKKLGSAGYVIEKAVFLRELAHLASREGARISMGTPAIDFEKKANGWKVLAKESGKSLVLSGKILIGCDGVNSSVAKKFFRRERFAVVSCFQYRMVNCKLQNPHMLEAYLGREVAPLGYAWMFPKDLEEVNVGIGTRGVPARYYLDRFVKSHPEIFEGANVVEIQAAPVPVGGEVREVVGDGILLCGDAAGQVIPLTGGGIHSSIVAGKIAGEVAGEAIEEGVDLDEYPKRYSSWSKRISNSLKALRLIERLSDSELNQLAGVLTGEDIVDLANGMNLRRVGKKLLRHPRFAVRLARSLLKG